MDKRRHPTYLFGPFCLDPAEHRLLRDGHTVPLTPKILELLRVLVENAGHLVEKDQLLKELWPDTCVEEANLNRGISVLRKALGESSGEQKYIETVPKRGYRFVGAVREENTASRAAPAHSHHPEDGGRPPTGTPATARAVSSRMVPAAAVAMLTLGAFIYIVLGRTGPNGQVIAPGPSLHRQLTFTGKEVTPALSPDGTRIAYVSTRSANRTVMVQELDGGRPIEIFSAPEAGALRWSPDGSDLMFWARGGGTDGLFIAPASGGNARKLANGLTLPAGLLTDRGSPSRCSWPARSYFSTEWEKSSDRLLCVARKSGSGTWIGRRRTTCSSLSPTMSNDVRPSGQSDRTDAIRPKCFPRRRKFPPHGGLRREMPCTTSAVSARPFPCSRASSDPTVRRQSSPTRRSSAASKPTDRSHSPRTVNRLVYARAPYHSNLWMVERGGSEGGEGVRQTQLTHGTSMIERPRVSPDGRSIVFNMGYESRANLYTIPALGGTPKQLTFLNGFSVGGAWSADGRKLAFASTEGGKPRVWIVNADGSSPQPLSQGEMSESFDITWSPGPRLLYQQAGNRNFYVLDSATGREHLLIKDSSVGWVGSPAYSPDGEKIAMSWNRRPNPGLWLIDGQNSSERLIWATPDLGLSNPFPIGWSSDGKTLYAFDGKRAAYRGVSVSFGETVTEAKILRVRFDGSQPETIVSLPFEEIGSVAMFPDERRLLCTVYSSRSDVWVVDNFDAAAQAWVRR